MARPKNIENTVEPRFDKITIPHYNDAGFLQIEVVHKADVTKEHIRRVLAFWDDLAAKDPSFNKETAIASVFKPIEETVEVSDDDVPISETSKTSKRKNLKVSKQKEGVSENDKSLEPAETEVSEATDLVSENTDSSSEEKPVVETDENGVSE